MAKEISTQDIIIEAFRQKGIGASQDNRGNVEVHLSSLGLFGYATIDTEEIKHIEEDSSEELERMRKDLNN